MWRHNVGTQQPENVLEESAEVANRAEPTSTHFNTSEFGKFLEVSKDKLTLKYTGSGQHQHDVGSIQGNLPVPRKQIVYYFEIQVLEAGDRCHVQIGFAPKGFNMGRQPGWEPNSYGYHGEDGRRHCNHHGDSPSKGEEYGPPFAKGDIVGAGIHLGTQTMFFTKNGQHLGVAFHNVLTEPLYPTVGLHSKNEMVRANFGREPFRFDVEGLVHEERTKQQEAVRSAEVPSGVLHALVEEYLLHYGYGDTIESFIEDACLPPLGPDPEFRFSSMRAEQNGHCTSNGDAHPEYDGYRAIQTMPLRHEVRELLMRGDLDGATKLLRTRCPALLEGQNPDLDVYFYINCQKFIEFIRTGDVAEAVNFARVTMAPLRGLLSHRSLAYDEMLRDVIALLAYPKPEESPLRALLGQGQREATADVVNAALLLSPAHAAHWHARPLARLERLLLQLVAVQGETNVANGGHGLAFSLAAHLQPRREPRHLHSFNA